MHISGVFHTLTGIVFVTVFISFWRMLPSSTPVADLESSIQLLAQVLALVVGVLLLGTTISLSSYDDAASLNTIQTELGTSMEPIFSKFFDSEHKIDRRSFRSWMLRKPGIQTLRFLDPAGKEDDRWIISRPRWDGFWFNIFESPFASTVKSTEQSLQIQRIHEAALCAFNVLLIVSQFRESGSALIKPNSGTNGSRWFIEDFNKYVAAHGMKLPSEANLSHTEKIISLAMNSAHYMREELQNHSENLEWEPFVLTMFQMKFNEYLTSMLFLIEKLQLLRLANLIARYPTKYRDKAKIITEALFLNLINSTKDAVAAIHSKIVTVHGSAKYFHSIKRMSIFGVGISLLVLIGLLVGWPFLKLAANVQTRNLGFIVLYSAGIAALMESSWFLIRLLWKRRLVG